MYIILQIEIALSICVSTSLYLAAAAKTTKLIINILQKLLKGKCEDSANMEFDITYELAIIHHCGHISRKWSNGVQSTCQIMEISTNMTKEERSSFVK